VEDAGTKDLSDERRLVSRVLRHWRELASGRRFPSVSQIGPWLVGDDWKFCFLIKLDRGKGPTFLTVGPALVTDVAALEMKPIVMCPSDTVLNGTLKYLPRCIANGPLSIDGAATHVGAPVLFRAVLLPLAEDGKHPDGTFGAVNYRPLLPGDQTARPSQVRML
jgi:hypothetical protein